MSDDEEFERTRDFVRSKRRPVRRTAGPRSGSFITSPATRRGHTGGAFEREVDKKVRKLMYPNAVGQVQDMPRWRHLPDPLPWLPQYATSGEALDAAVAAAMPRRSRSS